MNILDIIAKKRDKEELTKEEIEYFVKGYTEGTITDYQAAALIMAIFINGMSDLELYDLTFSMANSQITDHSVDVLQSSQIEIRTGRLFEMFAGFTDFTTFAGVDQGIAHFGESLEHHFLIIVGFLFLHSSGSFKTRSVFSQIKHRCQ